MYLDIPYGNTITVGEICNTYGGLVITTYCGKRYWAITGYDGDYWEEIPESLYQELLKLAAPITDKD